jgi:SAM-dependent methyltransferase
MTAQNDRLHPAPTQANYILLRTLRQQLERSIAEAGPDATLDVLDVGCGTKPYASLFDGRVRRYVGVDAAPGPAVDVVASAEALPCDAESFDCVLSSQMLEHVERPQRVLAEIHRVLRPGGIALVSTHGAIRYHAAPDRRPDDFRRWTHTGLALEFAQAAEWSRVVVTANGGTASALAFLFGRELETTMGALGGRALVKPVAFGLNLLAWHADRAFGRRLRGRMPDLVANYLVTAVK